jgi:hypothetical protein
VTDEMAASQSINECTKQVRVRRRQIRTIQRIQSYWVSGLCPSSAILNTSTVTMRERERERARGFPPKRPQRPIGL